MTKRAQVAAEAPPPESTAAEVRNVGINQVLQGDCVQLLSRLRPGSIDLAFADPPFNIGYEYDVYEDRRAAEEYLAWCRSWIDGLARALKPDGTFWLAIGDEFAAELKLQAQAAGFHCRSWVIWYYTFGVNCRRGFSRSHTHLFHFVKNPRQFTFNEHNPQVRVKSARELVYADRRANPRGRLPDNTWIIRPQDAPHSFRPHEDTWYFARVAGTFKERMGHHGCQMPEQLLGRIIRATSAPHELVLDPFGGSGTTLAVAKKLGRRWIGFELSADYAAAIERRLAAVEVGDPLDGPENALTSAPPTARGKKARRTASADQEDQDIQAAYRESNPGVSVDWLLCDPEKNAEFVAACRRRGLAGEAHAWNLRLLRLRKAKRLEVDHRESGDSPGVRDSDGYRHASEIALRLLAVDYDLSLERLLCSPEYAAEFDALAASLAPGFTAQEYRWGALALRKRAGLGRLRRQLAEHQEAWSKWPLPPRYLLAAGETAVLPTAGVYALFAGDQPLYVGESDHLARRLQQAASLPRWQEWGADRFATWDVAAGQRAAFQAFLARQLGTPLNFVSGSPQPESVTP